MLELLYNILILWYNNIGNNLYYFFICIIMYFRNVSRPTVPKELVNLKYHIHTFRYSINKLKLTTHQYFDGVVLAYIGFDGYFRFLLGYTV